MLYKNIYNLMKNGTKKTDTYKTITKLIVK